MRETLASLEHVLQIGGAAGDETLDELPGFVGRVIVDDDDFVARAAGLL
jgi:hypothetical protein